LTPVLLRFVQTYLASPEAKAKAVAAAAEAEAEAKEGAVHEDNEWNIQVVADEVGEGSSNAALSNGAAAAGLGAGQLPEGIVQSMPTSQVDAKTLETDAVQTTGASVDELAGELAALFGK
jgi:hypothetical protein